jgi:stearoyl-CoA desaturase (delta-9 desaturase)
MATITNLHNEPSIRPAAAPRVLRSATIRRAQHLHATAIVVVGALGIGIAICLAIWGHGPDVIDLGIFLGCMIPIALGSSVGFHRHFTHRSFKAVLPVRVALCILGSASAQGTMLFWVALHRRHHENAESVGDPHSPYIREDGTAYPSRLHGVWHSYLGWTFQHDPPNSAYYCRDLLQNKTLCRVNNLYLLWVALGLAIPAVVGGALHGSWLGALSGLVWGGFLRIFIWHNMIWYVTSLAHVIGRRDFRSGDMSTNNVWLALPTHRARAPAQVVSARSERPLHPAARGPGPGVGPQAPDAADARSEARRRSDPCNEQALEHQRRI